PDTHAPTRVHQIVIARRDTCFTEPGIKLAAIRNVPVDERGQCPYLEPVLEADGVADFRRTGQAIARIPEARRVQGKLRIRIGQIDVTLETIRELPLNPELRATRLRLAQVLSH